MATTTTPRGLPPNGETTNPANFHPRRVGRRRRRRRARLPTALRAKACSRRGFVAWRVSRVRATKKAIPVDGCTVRGVREVVGAPQSCPPQFLSLVSLLLQIKDPGLRFFLYGRSRDAKSGDDELVADGWIDDRFNRKVLGPGSVLNGTFSASSIAAGGALPPAF
mmetsp:Transcript_8551/g.25314  ORF Transcript_8551/g.25314 Transcript_8551/m.25314 type:complete len:165 (+) Transcript_8551:577-1071(+)